MKVYLDNNATTGLDERVKNAMLQELGPLPANPSSTHHFGREARTRLVKARQTIADFLQVKPTEIVFTSGGTEAINMLLRGLFPCSNPGHIITSDVEHSAVLNTLRHLKKQGCQVSFLPAGLWGAVQPEDIEKALQKDTRLIILGAANNETGVKHDIAAIAEIASRAKIPFILDAVALFGKELFRIPKGVMAMAVSGHKFHAPKGSGFAYIRSDLKLEPLLTGGDQEWSRRAGTENLPGIIGLSKAIELLPQVLPQASEQMRRLRDKLETELIQKLGSVLINGAGPRSVNTSNLSFINASGEDLLMALDMAGIAVSHGSACSSGALEPSRVLTNMGLPKQVARSSIRFSLSRQTTAEEIDICIKTVCEIVQRLRSF